MEVIELSGYVAEEKLAIAERYLIPEAMKTSGLTAEQVKISSDAIMTLNKDYCRESGVRNLKKKVEKIFRRAALRIVRASEEGRNEIVGVDGGNLKEFIGNPMFTGEVLYENPPSGVVMGLAYTGMGMFKHAVSVGYFFNFYH